MVKAARLWSAETPNLYDMEIVGGDEAVRARRHTYYRGKRRDLSFSTAGP
ncbi:MAG: hypothetical protein ACLRSW_11835 [Christensenellaceae bacterium]